MKSAGEVNENKPQPDNNIDAIIIGYLLGLFTGLLLYSLIFKYL